MRIVMMYGQKRFQAVVFALSEIMEKYISFRVKERSKADECTLIFFLLYVFVFISVALLPVENIKQSEYRAPRLWARCCVLHASW